MKYTLILFCCLLSFFPSNVFCQNQLPTVIPPSPQYESFMRYGDYPVSYNMGIPDISIPLYTIKAGDLEVPITLRYHASGIKPKDPDLSNVGAGWSLDVGGLISRTVRGVSDELAPRPNPFLQTYQLPQNHISSMEYLSSIITGRTVDVQHDKFDYSFLGHSGSFAIEDDGTGHFTAYAYPFKPYKIDVQIAAPVDPKYYKSIAGIDITDDKGVKYTFGHSAKESVASPDGSASPTGFFLEQIINPSNTNQIQFNYDNPTDIYSMHAKLRYVAEVTDQGGEMDNFGTPCTTAPATYALYYSTGQSLTYAGKVLTSIYFKNGHILFTLNSTKTLIQSFTVYNDQNVALKTFSFNLDNFPGSTLLYRLNSVQMKDAVNNSIDNYNFTYNLGDGVTPDNNCSEDSWGYCNGVLSSTQMPIALRNISVVEPQTTNAGSGNPPHNMQIGYIDTRPVDGYAERFSLSKIQYPTGGTTEFSYEINRYQDELFNIQPGGGLRIRQIVSKDNLGGSFTRTYEYAPGFIEYTLNPNNSYYVQTVYPLVDQCYVDGNRGDDFYMYQNRIFSNNCTSILGENRVYYTQITEYTGDQTSNTGKTVFNYTYDNPNWTAIDINAYIMNYENWGNGLLHKKEVYKNTGGGNYVKISDVTDTYGFTDIKTLNDLYAITAFPYNGQQDPINCFNTRQDLLSSLDYYNLPFPCEVHDSYVTTGAFYLLSEETNEYSGTQTLNKVVQYKYDNPANFYTTEKTVTGSDGNQWINRTKYPQDMTDAVSLGMVAGNILSPVVQDSVYKNSTFIQANKTNFRNWGNNLYAAETVEMQNGANASEVRLRYYSYDGMGNVSGVSKEKDEQYSYIWDYHLVYPVAQAINAAVSDIAYTSFEADGTGNWTISGGTLLTGSGLTGSNSYSLPSGSSISKTGLNAARNYKVTYWSSNGPLSISGTTGVSGLTRNGWTFYQHILPAGSTSVIIAGSGNILDELRLYPVDAQMTTYTYIPLIGQSSGCSVNNMVTYYEYDNYGRLLRIRDMDKNILKQYEYQYQATAAFLSTLQTRNFTRSNCAAGGSPSTVTYTVAAGTYGSSISQADADAKATNDINTKGQAYANLNGYCTFHNGAHSGNFTRNNCATGGTPSTVTYTVTAGSYSSTVSQADADQQAINAVASGGQAYANANATCTFSNAVHSGSFTRNNCAAGGTGSSVPYSIAAGSYHSTISQADADQQAINALNANGQSNANTNGTCTFHSAAASGTFTKDDCSGLGQVGNNVTYTVGAGAYSSTVSQADANSKAQNDVNTNGQAYADAHGSCVQQTIYARLRYENSYTDYDGTVYADVVVRFYSDGACTQPVTYAGGITVNYSITTTCSYSVTSNYSDYTYGVDDIIYSSTPIYYPDPNYDPSYGIFCSADYALNAGVYIIRQ